MNNRAKRQGCLTALLRNRVDRTPDSSARAPDRETLALYRKRARARGRRAEGAARASWTDSRYECIARFILLRLIVPAGKEARPLGYQEVSDELLALGLSIERGELKRFVNRLYALHDVENSANRGKASLRPRKRSAVPLGPTLRETLRQKKPGRQRSLKDDFMRLLRHALRKDVVPVKHWSLDDFVRYFKTGTVASIDDKGHRRDDWPPIVACGELRECGFNPKPESIRQYLSHHNAWRAEKGFFVPPSWHIPGLGDGEPADRET